MKSVLFIATSSNASPARGGRRRIVDVAHQTIRLGIKARILCFLPCEQVARGWAFLKNGKASLTNESGVPVHYWPMLPLTRFLWIDRLNAWYCGVVTALFCWFYHVNVAYGHGLGAARLALVARCLRKSLWVIADIHGAGVAEYAYQKQLQKEDRTIQRLEALEKQVITKSDHIIFVSHRMYCYYKDKLNQEITNHTVLPCAINTFFTADRQKREGLRREYHLADHLVVAYAGSAVVYQQVEEMCILFKEIQQLHSNAHFLILSHHRQKFENSFNQHEINPTDVTILSVDHSQVFDLLQMGDVGLMLRDGSIVNQVASPTKFAEYLVCGLPVLTTPHVGDYSQYVTDHNLGHIVDLDNLSVDPAFETFLQDVIENRAFYSKRCVDFVSQHLVWDQLGNQLGQVFSQLTDRTISINTEESSQ